MVRCPLAGTARLQSGAKTYLGIKDDAYDKIDDLSERGEDEQLAWLRKTRPSLRRASTTTGADARGQTSYDIWTYQLERTERNLPYRRRGYVFTQMQGGAGGAAASS